MEIDNNFWLIWIIYAAAAALMYWIFWRVTAFQRARWWCYSLRGLMLALIITPWYANTEGTTMAPALMVMTLDAITIGGDAATRAMVPLLLALVVADFAVTIVYFLRRKKKRS